MREDSITRIYSLPPAATPVPALFPLIPVPRFPLRPGIGGLDPIPIDPDPSIFSPSPIPRHPDIIGPRIGRDRLLYRGWGSDRGLLIFFGIRLILGGKIAPLIPPFPLFLGGKFIVLRLEVMFALIITVIFRRFLGLAQRQGLPGPSVG